MDNYNLSTNFEHFLQFFSLYSLETSSASSHFEPGLDSKLGLAELSCINIHSKQLTDF